MSFDNLMLAKNAKALRAMTSNSAGNEKVLLSMKLLKINRKGKAQNRVLLITSRHIFNLMPDNFSKVNRCMDIGSLHHISKSARDSEFAIHLVDEYDYRFKSPMYEQVVIVLKDAYHSVTGKDLDVEEVGAVEDLARQMLTKADLAKGSTRSLLSPSGKIPGQPSFSGSPTAAASPRGGAPSSKMDADDNDSEGDDEVRELANDSAAGAAGEASMKVGGAFAKKGRYSIDDFTVLRVLGKGAFGKVMLVRCKDDTVIYAMKSLNKQQLREKGEVTHTKTERKALEDTHHPYLVHLRFAFQTSAKLYLVMDYCNGGELFYHLKTAGRFDEPRARLYAAEILSALHHLHGRKIVYRDLKPENVLLDHEGHVRITDFGLAKDAMELGDKTHTFCGTPDYLAPEIIKGSGHGRGVDWWSLGTMIYEMLGGLPPFYSENFNIMYDQILHAELRFKPAEVFKPDAMALITDMLKKDPAQRLGSGDGDGEDIKAYAWFKPIDWGLLQQRKLKPSFVPKVKSDTDTSNFDEEFTSQTIEDSVAPDSALSRGGKSDHFEGFTYVDKGPLNIS